MILKHRFNPFRDTIWACNIRFAGVLQSSIFICRINFTDHIWWGQCTYKAPTLPTKLLRNQVIYRLISRQISMFHGQLAYLVGPFSFLGSFEHIDFLESIFIPCVIHLNFTWAFTRFIWAVTEETPVISHANQVIYRCIITTQVEFNLKTKLCLHIVIAQILHISPLRSRRFQIVWQGVEARLSNCIFTRGKVVFLRPLRSIWWLISLLN